MLITPDDQAKALAVMLRALSSLGAAGDSDVAGIFTQSLSSLPGVSKAFVCLGDSSRSPWDGAIGARHPICASCRATLPRPFTGGRFDCPLLSTPQVMSFSITSHGRAFGSIAVAADEGASAWLRPVLENASFLLGQVLENRLHAKNAAAEKPSLDSAVNEDAERLLHDERPLEQTFHGLEEGLCALDRDLNIVRTSGLAQEHHASQMPLVGRKCYEACRGRSQPCEICPSLKAFRTGRPCVEEVPYIDERGERAWMEVSAFPMRDESGSVIRVIEIVRNVTARQLAAEALRASEEKYRAIFDSSLVATFTTSIDDGLVLDANDYFAQICGYAGREEMIGKACIASAYVESGARKRLIAQLRSQAGPLSYEHALRRKDGSVFWIRGSVRLNENEGCLEGVAIDVTAEKAVGEDLRLTQFAVDHAVDAAYWLDRNGRFVYVNDAACKMYGYARDQLLAMNVTQTDFATDPRTWNDDWERVAREGSQTYQWTKRRKDGTPFPVELTLCQVQFGDSEYRCVFARDISQRLKLEDALRLTQYAVDHSVDAAYWLDRSGRFVYVNDAACKMYGYAREELLAMHMTQVDFEPCPLDWNDNWEQVAKHGPRTLQCTKRRKDGMPFPMEMTIYQVQSGDSEYRCVFARDITQRLELEEALRLTQYAIDNSFDGAYWLDKDGRFVYANDATCLMYGYTRDELLTMHAPDTDADGYETDWPSDWEDGKREGHRTTQMMKRRKDGTIFPAEITINYVPFGDKEYRCVFVRDITQRLKLEETVRLTQYAVDHSVDAAYWLDKTGRFVYVNDAACRMYGYTRDQLLSMHVTHTDFAPEYRSWNDNWEEVSKQSPRTYQFLKRRSDGTTFPVEMTLNHLKFSDTEYRCVFARDITERVKLEEALRLTQYAVDHAVDAAYWLDKTGRFVYVNDAACKMYGYARDQLLAMHVTETDFAPNPLPWDEDWQKVSLDGSQTYQQSKRRSDGTPFPVELTLYQVRFGDKDYRCVFARDITERVKLEENLRLTQYAVDHAVDAAYWLDATGRFAYVNDTACAMYGYTREELLAMHIMETDVTPNPAVWDERWQKLADGGAQTYFSNKRRKDGTSFTAELTCYTLAFAEKKYRCVFARDITDRLKLERTLKLTQYVVDHASEAAFLVDRQARFVYVNDAACAMFGYSRDELLNMRLFDTFGGPLGDSWDSHWEKVRAHGTLRSEGRHRRKDGTIFPTEILINHVEFDGQEYHFDFASDVSDRLALEEQLRQAQKMEAVGRLAGGVAHDFNNALQGIIGSAEMALAETAQDDPRYVDLSEIRIGASRAAELTGQLLAFSRRQILQPRDIDLNALIDETLRLLRRVLPENIHVDFVRERELATVYADPAQIQQVVVNLCLNARDAMAQGGILTIETSNVALDDAYCQANLWARPGTFALLTVSDNGCGMDEGTLSHIFEPFFTTKEVGKGTGLGLATVYGIVRQHDGMITAYSEIGSGTTIRIYMPKVARIPAPAVQLPLGPVRGGVETILVAEDEPIVRSLDQRILEHHGYAVILANDGDEAVRLFEENKDIVDLAFLDLVMPKLGGLEASLKMRQIKPSLKLLFASGYSVAALHGASRDHEGLPILAKPYNPDDLLRKLREVLDQ